MSEDTSAGAVSPPLFISVAMLCSDDVVSEPGYMPSGTVAAAAAVKIGRAHV